ncbi:diaminopimelate decarboxylase [Ammonifex degensii KC4]|uniref:Diaminopimelate decarboxylase n=1 Tax=Ammonifex degensii (strain DSM 10501 / KC4) TaxID=429009 RepID=C9R7Y2_AMMDK|nr:diaminopimelate decarboxylase [Ammonifex degensii]ACX52411.1 diaminopimelate decarboxylase [Ammonifex degensii KC4]
MRIAESLRVNAVGHLEIGEVDTVHLAREYGTPLYVLDEEVFRANCRRYLCSLGPGNRAAYAGKALLTLAICRICQEEGLYLDVVSAGELYTAVKAGFPPERLYFHGNNKSLQEIEMGLELGVGRFVVDNFYELELLEERARALGKKPAILLRLTPGIEAHTHEYIRTGQLDSKFGFPLATGVAEEAVRRALSSPHLELVGLHCHIGSQILRLEPFQEAARVMVAFAASIRRKTGWVMEELDLGGGLGIRYTAEDDPPAIEDYVQAILRAVEEACQEEGLPLPRIVVEPGRSIVGPAGITLYTVGAIKEIPGVRTYVAVDGGMADNPRPALYQARYEAVLANRMLEPPAVEVAVAGKCCESGDILIPAIKLPRPQPGDILAVFATGAYNYSMSMNYNRLPRPAMVLVRGGEVDLIVARETLEDLISHDRVPERLWK